MATTQVPRLRIRGFSSEGIMNKKNRSMWRPVSGHRICGTGAIPAGLNGAAVPAPSQGEAAGRQPSPAHIDAGPCWLAQAVTAQLGEPKRASCRHTGIGRRRLAMVYFRSRKVPVFGATLARRDGSKHGQRGHPGPLRRDYPAAMRKIRWTGR